MIDARLLSNPRVVTHSDLSIPLLPPLLTFALVPLLVPCTTQSDAFVLLWKDTDSLTSHDKRYLS